ncbi:MAG: hypothetical protein KAQ98_08700, partial [Bacteriovoracaceae bacterium]|nr:hypothetical protein [Bacteriovoracaceae bacterium]
QIENMEDLEDIEISYGGSAQWQSSGWHSHTISANLIGDRDIEVDKDGNFTLPKVGGLVPLRCLNKTCTLFVGVTIWFKDKNFDGPRRGIAITHYVSSMYNNDEDFEEQLKESVEQMDGKQIRLWIRENHDGYGYSKYEIL